MKTIEESGTKRFTKKGIIKMLETFPRSNAPDSNFGNKDVNMRVPLKAAAEGMENTNETRSKTLSFVENAKHTKDDVTDRMKEAIGKRTISAKEDAQFFGDGENTMSVNALDNLKRHRSGALNGIEVTAGRAETALAAKGNKFERTTRRTPKHGAAKGGITATNHLFNGFHNDWASFECILDFFEMI